MATTARRNMTWTAVVVGLVLAAFSACTRHEDVPQPAQPADKRPAVASAGPATPEEAVARLEAASKAGDLDQAAEVFPEPFASLLKDTTKARGQVMDVHGELLAALDTRFGKLPHAGPPLGSEGVAFALKVIDPAHTRQEVMALQSMKVVKKEKDGDRFVLTVEIKELQPSGLKTRTESLAAVKQGGSWRLLMEPGMKMTAAETKALRKEKMDDSQRLLEAYRATIQAVNAGKFATRDEVNRVMLDAYEAYVPGVKALTHLDDPGKSRAEPTRAEREAMEARAAAVERAAAYEKAAADARAAAAAQAADAAKSK